MSEKNNNITYEIKEHIGTISSWDSGWNRELNVISWNGAKPKYDIREWDHEHDRMSKGITLHPWEMRNLVDLYLTNNSEKAVAAGRAREANRQRRRAEYRRADSEDYSRMEEAKDAKADLQEVSDGPAFAPVMDAAAPNETLLSEPEELGAQEPNAPEALDATEPNAPNAPDEADVF